MYPRVVDSRSIARKNHSVKYLGQVNTFLSLIQNVTKGLPKLRIAHLNVGFCSRYSLASGPKHRLL